MSKNLISRLYIRLQKHIKSLDESIDIADYINPYSFSYTVEGEPFKHVVIDNFFKEDFAKKLKEEFNKKLSEGFSGDYKDLSKFRVFDPKIKYDGYVYTPKLNTDETTAVFYSLTWNIFFQKMFNKPTTFGTNMAFHHHPPHDATGWVHNDYATHIFPQKLVLPNGVHASAGENISGGVESERLTKNAIKQKRTIALIYYFNDTPWNDGDGGETGLYASRNEKDLVKKIAPRNNRLLAFDVSPKSFHAFQENKFERNSIVQWFHVDLDWAEKEYGFL